MNQAQPQGQAGAQPGQQQRPPPMYTAATIETLPYITDEEKTRYKAGLQGLWNKVSNTQPETPESQQARRKIIEFSRMLVNKITQRRQAQAQGQPQQGQQGQPGQQQGQQGQQAQQAQPQPQQPTPQPQPAQPAQQQPAQTQASPVTQNAAAQAAMAQRQQNAQAQQSGANAAPTTAVPAPTNQAQGAQAKPRLPDHIMQHLNKMNIQPPASYAAGKSQAEIQRWIDDAKDRYGKALLQMDTTKKQMNQFEKLAKDRAESGNPLNETEMATLNQRKDQQMKAWHEAKSWADSFRKQVQANNSANAPAPAAAGQQPAAQAQAQQPQAAATPVNPALEAAKQQQANRATNPPQTPVHPPQRPGPSIQQPANPQQPKQEQPTQQTPVNAPQPQAMQQARAATQPVPPTGPASGQGRALTHSAALSLANSRASNTPGSAPIQGQPQQPQQQAGNGAGTPGSAGPQSQGAMNVQQGHPHAHPGTQQPPTIQSKMPIPKQLPERAMSVPSGVTVGGGVAPGRPTMSQGSGTLGGVMSQPAVAKVQAYNHEAEGDHVLSKKKLDELVRQVCGGTAEGQEGNMLTPDVEESVLNMADSFVDNVLHAACRNAKERGSKVLEIRDIQLVLERTYNIRVPGYSSDELRTVRKVQPASGWIAKMSAVQAAKVMPGKGE
ncbi:hypothetical protein CC79DRAFT_1366421 [Sarocladium strictum]